MKAYKAFDKNLQCRGVQYSVGDTFEEDSDVIKLCASGIHVCPKLTDVFKYYPRTNETRVCEVEIIGEDIDESEDKIACREIKIVRELSREEIDQATDFLRFNSGHYNSGHYNSGDYNSGYYNSGYRNTGDYNSGHYNSGNYNSGDYNSGYRNTGDYNSGHYNSGYYNSGYRNTGDYNSGHYNSGHHNSGHRNSGHYNSGHYNSGNYNSGNYNSGYFNNTNNTVRLFNKETSLSFYDERLTKVRHIMTRIKPVLTWVSSSNMTEREKKGNPSHATTGGFLRKSEDSYKRSWINLWKTLTNEEKECFTSLPNFDWDVFTDITGIEKE